MDAVHALCLIYLATVSTCIIIIRNMVIRLVSRYESLRSRLTGAGNEEKSIGLNDFIGIVIASIPIFDHAALVSILPHIMSIEFVTACAPARISVAN